jgi:hypothetical protein
VCQAATAVPPSQLLLDYLFDVVHKSGVAQACQDAGSFGDELLGVVLPVDSNWVDLKQDLEQFSSRSSRTASPLLLPSKLSGHWGHGQ